MRARLVCLLACAGALAGCAAETAAGSPDGRDDVGLTAGKADGTEFNDCELEGVVTWVNDPGTTVEILKDAGVHSRAAGNIIEHRNGDDGAYGTDDDRPFEDIVQIDDVYYVGPVAIRQLVDAIADRCVDPGLSDIEVVFSPKPYYSSHLVRTANLIDDAERSIDIAMYSFRDNGIKDALGRARDRGVSIRMIFDSASEHRTDPDGTLSATLEDMGIEVRWINKIMHHKLAIIDGVRAEGDDPAAGVLVTGSGNWSHSAGTRYEENTLIVRRNPELLLRFQREFNHLWEHSRELVWNEAIEHVTSVPITDAMITDDPAVDAVYTSANFRTYYSSRYGETFSAVRGERNVAERMAEIIDSATSSIHVASGHLRSRLIAEALMRKAAENPSVDIRVYLDGQEWISQWYHDRQTRDLDRCLAEAEDDRDREDCMFGGMYFSYELAQQGIPTRFKYYAYRWDYSYAEQMHHKFFVVDGRWLVTGSYNWSDNAETNTMENVVILDGDRYPAVVQDFEDEFERMWATGESEGLYDALLADVRTGTGPMDIVFPPMALTWEQVDVLKDAIRAACPDVDTAEFREDPSGHRVCYR